MSLFWNTRVLAPTQHAERRGPCDDGQCCLNAPCEAEEVSPPPPSPDLHPRMHAGKLRATRHTSCGAWRRDHLASTSSSESVATIVLRQRIQPGHAVSLASIAEHPINKISAGASTTSETQGNQIFLYRIVLLPGGFCSEANIKLAQTLPILPTDLASLSNFVVPTSNLGPSLCSWNTHLAEAYCRL